MKNSEKQRILSYLNKQTDWVAGGRICDVARTEAGYMGETTMRRLRELCNENKIQKKMIDGYVHFKVQLSADEMFNAL